MKILHIAWIDNNQANGVSIIVPKHMENQEKYEEIGFLNCSKIKIDTVNIEKIKIYSLDYYRKRKNFICEYNIIIFHEIYRPIFCNIAKIAKKYNIPYIVVPHGGMTELAQSKKRIKKYIGNQIMFNKFINNATSIQFLSEAEKESTIRNVENNFVCGNGMSIDKKFIKSNKEKEDGFKIIYIGRMDPFHKGIDILVEACEKIKKSMFEQDIQIMLYGPDHEGGKEKIKKLIEEKDLGENIFLNDKIFQEEKLKVLRECDAFILPSRFEGQPLAAIEALAIGTPIIITPGTNLVKEIREMDCGWVCDFTSNSIGEKILIAASEKNKLRELSLNSIKCAEKNFSWKLITEKNLLKYREIINNKNKR